MADQSALDNRVQRIHDTEGEHLDLLQQIVSADFGNVFGVDLVAIAAIHRSLALIDGFVVLVQRNNPLCALALLRLQLDSVMRLFACTLVADPHSLASDLLQDRPLATIKSAGGHKLTDRFLHERLSEIYPWVTPVYENTSGFIHLSQRHMIAPVSGVDSNTRSVTFDVGAKRVRWPTEKVVEALDAFAEATQALLDQCRSWLQIKIKASEQRADQ